MISFFPVRDIPLRSISLNLIFEALFDRSDLSDFRVNTATGSRSIIFQIFDRDFFPAIY